MSGIQDLRDARTSEPAPKLRDSGPWGRRFALRRQHRALIEEQVGRVGPPLQERLTGRVPLDDEDQAKITELITGILKPATPRCVDKSVGPFG